MLPQELERQPNCGLGVAAGLDQDIPIARREAAIVPNSILDGDRRKAAPTILRLVHQRKLPSIQNRSYSVDVTMPPDLQAL